MTIKVYDNGGATADRYTVLISNEGQWDIYTMSADQGPQGVNQYSHSAPTYHWSDEVEVSFHELPKQVQAAIKERMQ